MPIDRQAQLEQLKREEAERVRRQQELDEVTRKWEEKRKQEKLRQMVTQAEMKKPQTRPVSKPSSSSVSSSLSAASSPTPTSAISTAPSASRHRDSTASPVKPLPTALKLSLPKDRPTNAQHLSVFEIGRPLTPLAPPSKALTGKPTGSLPIPSLANKVAAGPRKAPVQPPAVSKPPKLVPLPQVQKRQRVDSFDEYDEDDGFVDDSEADGDVPISNVSKMIGSIFGYNRFKFRNEDEDDGSDMVASLDQIRREDARARRIARLEDAREEREEQYRLERKRLKK